MPTYEFRCANGHVFEQFHKISDAPSSLPCPECGAVAERAISGGAGLVFKGSGFYLTDYGKNAHRSGSSTPPSGSESKAESSAPKSDAGSSSAPSTPAAPASAPKSDGGSKGTA